MNPPALPYLERLNADAEKLQQSAQASPQHDQQRQ